MKKQISCVLMLVTLSGIVGCASNSNSFQATFDTTSGLTVSSLPEPVTLARSTPRISVSARDYVHLGPVEINRMGNKELYLWLGLASTLDRLPLGETPPLPTVLVIVADGIPMRLPLEDWEPVTMGVDPYQVSTEIYHSLRTRMAGHQLSLLAGANDVKVYLQAEQTSPVRYRHWSGSLQDWAPTSAETATAKRQ